MGAWNNTSPPIGCTCNCPKVPQHDKAREFYLLTNLPSIRNRHTTERMREKLTTSWSERYLDLKEKVGDSIPSCEISSLPNWKLVKWSTVSWALVLAYWPSVSETKLTTSPHLKHNMEAEAVTNLQKEAREEGRKKLRSVEEWWRRWDPCWYWCILGEFIVASIINVNNNGIQWT